MIESKLIRNNEGFLKIYLGKYGDILKKKKINLKNYKFSDNPFPHCLKSNCFSDEKIEEILKFWPSNHWANEVKGNFTYEPFSSLLYREKRRIDNLNNYEFLENFFLKNMSDLARDTIYALKNYLPKHKLNFNEDVICDFAGLMETNNEFEGHQVHHHVYHNPNWFLTILVYLNKDVLPLNGTSLNKISSKKNFIEKAKICAETLTWFNNSSVEVAKTFSFINGQMLAFVESPLSLHSVQKHDLPQNNRYVLRLHVGFKDEWVKKKYGMTLNEFRSLARNEKRYKEYFKIVYKDLKEFEFVIMKNKFFSMKNKFLNIF